MGQVYPLRRPPSRQENAHQSRLLHFSALWLAIFALAFAAAIYGDRNRSPLSLPEIGEPRPASAVFARCGGLRRDNCVIDGDTFTFNGERIRIADIDAPETHPSRCASEERLGAEATRRLQALLNEGPFVLESIGRDTDRYGRKLRIVTRGNRSVGAILVREGLARPWEGRRRSWCS